MNDDKQYLFAANGSYFGQVLIAAAFLFPVAYGALNRGWIDYNEANVLMFPLGVALLLTFAATTEACMMIRSKGYLFAYNVDKAMCVSLDMVKWEDAVAIARKLYGPVFDADCAQRFSPTPKSPFLRKMFYSLITVMFLLSVVSPCYHINNAFVSGAFSSKLITAWGFIVFDAIMLANRFFFRSSIRRFWAATLGDDNFRAILNFELSHDNSVRPPDTTVTNGNSLAANCIPGYNQRLPSKRRIVVISIVMIAIVVATMNLRRNPPKQKIPDRDKNLSVLLYATTNTIPGYISTPTTNNLVSIKIVTKNEDSTIPQFKDLHQPHIDLLADDECAKHMMQVDFKVRIQNNSQWPYVFGLPYSLTGYDCLEFDLFLDSGKIVSLTRQHAKYLSTRGDYDNIVIKPNGKWEYLVSLDNRLWAFPYDITVSDVVKIRPRFAFGAFMINGGYYRTLDEINSNTQKRRAFDNREGELVGDWIDFRAYNKKVDS